MLIDQSVISAVALLREPAKPGETIRMQPLASARRAILELLEQNDNTDNMVRLHLCRPSDLQMLMIQFSDCHYTASTLAALGNVLGTAPDIRASTAIEKAITFDRLIPSFGNVVTKAGLQVRPADDDNGQRRDADPSRRISKPCFWVRWSTTRACSWATLGMSPRDKSHIVLTCRSSEGNLRSLRLAAIDSLLLCKPLGRNMNLAKYLFHVVENDASLVVRRHVARALSASILMALATGDFINAPSIIDTNGDEQARRDKTDKAIVKAIRADYERKPELMQLLSGTLMYVYLSCLHRCDDRDEHTLTPTQRPLCAAR